MSGIDPDRDLRDLFSRLREEDRAQAPSFDAVRGRAAPVRKARPVWALMVASVAAAALIVVALTVRREVGGRRWEQTKADSPFSPPTSLLNSPTDFLLDTPGSGLLRTVPSFGIVRGIGTTSTNLRPRNRS